MKIKTHTQIFIAMILGVAAGITARIMPDDIAGNLKFLGQITGFVGDYFIRLLKMIIVPLIFTSMVAGVISVGSFKDLGKMGWKTFLYYMSTTLLAVFAGLILVNIIAPGVGFDFPGESIVQPSSDQELTVLTILMDIVPTNIFKAMADGNVLSVIFFSLLLGTAITAIGKPAEPVANFFSGFNEVMMKITHWIMLLAPIGVFALLAKMVSVMNPEDVKNVAKYFATVIIGLGIHGAVTLPILLWVFGRCSPIKFFRNMFSAVATAFSTASSAATLPITMECLEKKAGVSNRVTSFVLPLGATINMDGTALYEAVAAMFIAQAYDIDLTIAQQVVIMLTATLASIGAAAIPSAGLVTMVIVLDAVGLPLEGLGMIWAVDRLLDMCRTAVNVWGDSCGAMVVARLDGEKITTPDQ